MSPPTTSRTFRRTADGASIEMVTENVPQTLQPNEVLVKIHAVSINFRDVGMLTNRYPVPVMPQGIPCSDASASVVSIGSSVKDFQVGDRVTPAFQRGRITGREKNAPFLALGGDVEGVLREYAVFEERVLTKVPPHLSHEEVATIACAGVTAWTALDMHDPLHEVGVALMQGTGGVSIFAVLICLAAGITPIATSSSDEKLEQVRALGTEERPVLGINYRTLPDWAAEAQRLTGGAGVDVVVNNVGAAAMEQSFAALGRGGTISLVGFLGGSPEKMPDCVMPAMMKMAKMQGINVGSVKDQQDLCGFLAEKKVDLTPLVEKKTFEFESAAEAFKYVDSGAHIGKVVVRVAE